MCKFEHLKNIFKKRKKKKEKKKKNIVAFTSLNGIMCGRYFGQNIPKLCKMKDRYFVTYIQDVYTCVNKFYFGGH